MHQDPTDGFVTLDRPVESELTAFPSAKEAVQTPQAAPQVDKQSSELSAFASTKKAVQRQGESRDAAPVESEDAGVTAIGGASRVGRFRASLPLS